MSLTALQLLSITRPNGIATDGRLLYVSICGYDEIRVYTKRGVLVRTIETVTPCPGCLDYVDGRLYMSDESEAYITVLDLQGNALKEITTARNMTTGAKVIGPHLYTCYYTDNHYILDRRTGATLKQFTHSYGWGIGFDGVNMFVQDCYTEDIALMTRDGIVLKVLVNRYTDGFAFDGRFLWSADYSAQKVLLWAS